MATITNLNTGIEIDFGGSVTYIKHGNVKLLKRGNNINIYDDSDDDGGQRGQVYMTIGHSEVTSPVTDNIDELFNTVKGFVDVASGNIPFDNSDVQEGDALVANASGVFEPKPLNEIISDATLLTQGYYGLLSDFYFGGSATETAITISDVNTWVDVEMSVNASGLFDNRPLAMKTAQPLGHEGDGSNGSPIVFKLEGLDIRGFANFRASMAFEPEEDEGQLESRLLFNRHSGTSPSDDFAIEEVSLSMQQGADVDYVTEPMLSFFIGDTIDTNAAGDAGKCRFQIKSNVAGVLKLRALTWYINK